MDITRQQMHGIEDPSVRPGKARSELGPRRIPGAPTSAVATAVTDHPFLKGLSTCNLDRMVSCAALVDFVRGHLVFKQGDPARQFYLIVSGTIVLTHAGLHGNHVIQTLGPGEVLGWSWMFPPYAWHFNAMVTEPARLIAFDGERLKRLGNEHRDFGYEMLLRISKVVIDRLQKTRQRCFKIPGGGK